MEPTVYNELQVEIAQHFITFLKDNNSVQLAQSIMSLPQPAKFVGVTELCCNLYTMAADDADKLRSAVALIFEDTNNQDDDFKMNVRTIMFNKFYEIESIEDGHYGIMIDWNAVDDFFNTRKDFEKIIYN